ncbi:hypothetical protein E1281_34285 [Actinomadura sp. KC345]|nr:hypothetical protein E1281_34285 [Actinomadura sp. KC345]
MGARRGGKARRGRFMWARWLLVVVVCGAGAVIALCVPIIGFTMLGDGVDEMRDASALGDRGRYTVGTVQDTRVESDGPTTGYDHHILVRFTASDRSRHDVWADGDRRVGAGVRVLYDPRDPETATTGSVAGKRVDGITHIVGGGLLSIGLLTAYAGWGWSRLRAGRPRGKHGIT